jgi:Mn-dependent DtxR family transcriptional regulator
MNTILEAIMELNVNNGVMRNRDISSIIHVFNHQLLLMLLEIDGLIESLAGHFKEGFVSSLNIFFA